MASKKYGEALDIDTNPDKVYGATSEPSDKEYAEQMALGSRVAPYITVRYSAKKFLSKYSDSQARDEHGRFASDPYADKGGGPKDDPEARWKPENKTHDDAIQRLKGIKGVGPGDVDGEHVEDRIPAQIQYDGHSKEDVQQMLKDAKSTTTHDTEEVDPKKLIGTNENVDRRALAAVMKAASQGPGGKWYRPGYVTQVVRTPEGKMYVADGNHRVNGYAVLGSRLPVQITDIHN